MLPLSPSNHTLQYNHGGWTPNNGKGLERDIGHGETKILSMAFPKRIKRKGMSRMDKGSTIILGVQETRMTGQTNRSMNK